MTQSLNGKAELFFGQDRLQSEYFYKNSECRHASDKKGYSYPIGGSKVSLMVRGDTQRNKLIIEPALSLVPDPRAPPNGC